MENEKKRLRKIFSAGRKELSVERRAEFDAAIRRNICSLAIFNESSCVAAFCALGPEPDLLPILQEKRLFLPRYVEKLQTYELVEITDFEQDMVTGHYGILEPHPRLAAADRDFIRQEVLFLVPAVACGRDGTRLGRGGGFYDRMLESVAKPPVGVVYSCQIGGSMPVGRYDIPMGWVVTESEVIKCENGREKPSSQE